MRQIEIASSSAHAPLLSRREWLALTGQGFGSLLLGGCRQSIAPSAEQPAETFMRFPGKVPMRVLNDRPPCLETPWSYFRHDLTPNEAFYVRWHLQMIPTDIDLRAWRLKIGGHVDRPIEFSMDELRRFEAVSIVAVNQCSGNSRSRFDPRLPGAQWGNGAMGNARWTGVRLADLLGRAGIKPGAMEVSIAGLDSGGLASVPDYVKSLTIDVARQPDTLVAYEMNGSPLPLLNGFPARLVVPGWFATYWVKGLSAITVLDRPFEGFWVKEAYRIPATNDGLESPDHLAQRTIPIHHMRVRSFVVAPENGDEIPLSQPCLLDGIAFDGGQGIRRVEYSADGGSAWKEATLGTDLGRFSFRRWRAEWQPTARGEHRILVRATSNDGTMQPAAAGWNRAGYLRNVIESIRVHVV